MVKESKDSNLSAFCYWVSSKSTFDFKKYERRGKLNRVDISRECGFARSVCDQNPRVRRALDELESRLRSEGVLQSKTIQDQGLQDQLPLASSCSDTLRIKELELENAILRSELAELKEKFSKYTVFAETLLESGRIPR